MNHLPDPIAFNAALANFEITQAPGITVISGDAQDFLAAMGKLPQHNAHVGAYWCHIRMMALDNRYLEKLEVRRAENYASGAWPAGRCQQFDGRGMR